MIPVFGAPVLAAALSAQAPVKLAACRVTAPVANLHMGRDIGTTYSGDYALHVRFSDVSRRPIKRVVFALNDGSTVTDAGTFSPGVKIRQTLDLSPTNGDSCDIRSVTFSDGTRWTTAPTG
ncbi:MAG TPA: hypothetical protein VMA36_21480 [Candidatus Limnocylindria bacterium]|jgi:hypothetical protein|nr:hypothetical protein [Candidatus Limnocylindria bacterium]